MKRVKAQIREAEVFENGPVHVVNAWHLVSEHVDCRHEGRTRLLLMTKTRNGRSSVHMPGKLEVSTFLQP